MARNTKPWVKYALAAFVTVAALLLRGLLNPYFGTSNPYHTLWLAVVFTAWYCGIGPSILTIVTGAIGLWYWIMNPPHSFFGKNEHAYAGMLGFLVLSAIIVAMGESNRRMMERRERAEDGLKKAQEELEVRVRERTAALERKNAEVREQARLLDLANDAVFVKSAKGLITYWNQGAERLYGWTMTEALGHHASNMLHTVFPVPREEVESSDTWEGELIHTTRDGSQITVASRWTTLRDEAGNPSGWLEINTDITARKTAEDAARSLSSRILTLQDDERRRIARGLHDSLGQYLVALKMNLDGMAMTNGSQAAVAAECSQIVDKCLTETRTISHLLHPPLLDEAGFGSAARWYVDGFAQRSGIEVNLDLPVEVVRLRSEVEIALFRALQEALTNVHRHSGASKVGVRLSVDEKEVRLEVEDDGQGVPRGVLKRLLEGAAQAGIGISGMRERVRELGGSMGIESDSSGTLLAVSVPILEPADRKTSNSDDHTAASAA
ncbi:MAG TPA: ATP-binding protein [Terriglobales bacterium]